MRARKQCIELGLEVIECLRPEGVRLSWRAIAAVCGCSWQAIRLIERGALAKLRAALAARERMPAGAGGCVPPCPPARYRLAVAAWKEARG